MVVKGMSMRAVSRTIGVSVHTVTKTLANAGEACAADHDKAVLFVKTSHVRCGEFGSS